MLTVIHLLVLKYSLSTHQVPDIVLGLNEQREQNRQSFSLCALYFPVGEINSKYSDVSRGLAQLTPSTLLGSESCTCLQIPNP